MFAEYLDYGPMDDEEIVATVLLQDERVGNGWLMACGRDAGYIVGRVLSEDRATLYWFSIDPVTMVVDELKVIPTLNPSLLRREGLADGYEKGDSDG